MVRPGAAGCADARVFASCRVRECAPDCRGRIPIKRAERREAPSGRCCTRDGGGAGAHAVIAPRRRAAGLTAAAAKAASGAAETVPYLTVINLARALRALKNAGIQVIGTADDATTSLFDIQLDGALALVMGAEGAGMRRLTREACDEVVRIPLAGHVQSLNVSVASG